VYGLSPERGAEVRVCGEGLADQIAEGAGHTVSAGASGAGTRPRGRLLHRYLAVAAGEEQDQGLAVSAVVYPIQGAEVDSGFEHARSQARAGTAAQFLVCRLDIR